MTKDKMARLAIRLIGAFLLAFGVIALVITTDATATGLENLIHTTGSLFSIVLGGVCLTLD